jgi:TusA-related sulfurtransferase
MKRNIVSGVLAGALVVAGGVTVAAQGTGTDRQRDTQRQQQQQQQQAGGDQAARNEVCPVGIQGLRAQVSEAQDGAALVFTTESQESVRELRQKLNSFVRMHEQQMQQQPRGAQAGAQQREGAQAGTQQRGAQAGTQQRGAQAGTQQREGAQAGTQQQRRFADPQAMIHQGQVQLIEIPNGAVLLVEMENRDRLSQLRNELREDARALEQGRCPLSLQIES